MFDSCEEKILRDAKYYLSSETNEQIAGLIIIKLKSMLSITSQLLEKDPNNRMSALQLLELSDEWCINFLDIEEITQVQEILKMRTSTISNNQFSLHKAIVLGKFQSFSEGNILLNSTSFRKLHGIYPALQRISKKIISNVEWFYIFQEVEDKLLNENSDIDADILKIAHHGSAYSSSTDFLKKVNPLAAVISVGKNIFGHPSKEVLGRLKKENIHIYRTDLNGAIVVKSNGEKLRINSVYHGG